MIEFEELNEKETSPARWKDCKSKTLIALAPSKMVLAALHEGLEFLKDLPSSRIQGDLNIGLWIVKSSLLGYYLLYYRLICVQALFEVFLVLKIVSISLLKCSYKLHFHPF